MTAPNTWLEGLIFGLRQILNRGTEVTLRNTVDFLAPLAATDDSTNANTEISIDIADSSNGGIVPATATQYEVLQTDGSLDPDWALITNGCVDAAAAIDGTKIDPSFGAQNISTSLSCRLTGAGSALLFENGSGGTISGSTTFSIYGRTSVATNRPLFLWFTDQLVLGSTASDFLGLTLQTKTGTTIALKVNTTNEVVVTDNLVTVANSLALGSTVPAAGTVRVESGFVMAGRDAADGGDVNLVEWTSGDIIAIGANDGDLEGVTIDVPTGKTIDIGVAGSNELTVGSLVTIATALQIGSTVPAAGTMRVESGFTLAGRDAADGGDVNLIEWTSSDYVAIGANDGDLEGVTIDVPTGKAVIIREAGANLISASSSSIIMSQDVQVAATKDLDLNTFGAYFIPRRVRQAAQPTPQSGEMLIWSDSDDDSVHLVYNDANGGVVETTLT